MSRTFAAEAPPLTVLEGGAVRLTGTRMPLELLIRAHTERGLSAEQITEEYAPLALADVYAVLAYYHRHPDEVTAYLAESDARVEELRRKLVELRGPDLTYPPVREPRTFRAGEPVPTSGIWQVRGGSSAVALSKGQVFPPTPNGAAALWVPAKLAAEQS